MKETNVWDWSDEEQEDKLQIEESDLISSSNDFNILSIHNFTGLYIYGIMLYFANKIVKTTVGMEEILKKILNLLLIGWAILFYSAGCHAEDSLKQLFEQISPAVVTVKSYNSEGQIIQQGTGFFINAKGHLITNHHVLKDAYTADIEIKKGLNFTVEKVLAEDENADIVKISVNIPPKLFKWIKITSKPASTAERILVIGSPMGLEHTVSDGIVSAIRMLPDFGKIYQISAPVSPGSSGSPVINMNGETIGIATFQFFKGQNLNFAVPASHILTLLDLDTPKIVSEWNNYETDKKATKKGKSLAQLMDATKAPEETIIKYIIHLKNGKKLETDEYWEEGDWIKCNRYGTVVGYSKKQIEHIEKNEVVKQTDIVADYKKSENAKYDCKSKYGFYNIWYNRKWHQDYNEEIKNKGAEFQFKHDSDDVLAIVFPGSGFPSYASMVEEVLTSVSNSDARILYQDRRIVNSKDVFFFRMEEIINDIEVIQCNYCWTGRSGHVRFVAATEKYNFDKYEEDMMELLNGLVITRP